MAANSSNQILHRMVPLICQALTTSPNDETVWLEGLRLLSNPKLRTAMSLTSSIWLPLLLKGLEPSKSKPIIIASLVLLNGLCETLQPLKSCLVKPLKALSRDTVIGEREELTSAVERLGLVIRNPQQKEIGKTSVSTFMQHLLSPLTVQSHAGSTTVTPLPPVTPAVKVPHNPRDHPLVAEILARSLPAKTRSVQYAWEHTLMTSTHDNTLMWLPQLFQATLEASAVPEMVITARVSIFTDIVLTASLALLCTPICFRLHSTNATVKSCRTIHSRYILPHKPTDIDRKQWMRVSSRSCPTSHSLKRSPASSSTWSRSSTRRENLSLKPFSKQQRDVRSRVSVETWKTRFRQSACELANLRLREMALTDPAGMPSSKPKAIYQVPTLPIWLKQTSGLARLVMQNWSTADAQATTRLGRRCCGAEMTMTSNRNLSGSLNSVTGILRSRSKIVSMAVKRATRSNPSTHG